MKEKKKKSQYVVIQRWMIDNLKLKPAKAMALAVIYGFSQDGESWYRGGSLYIADWLGVTQRSVKDFLAELVSMGVVEMRKEMEGGVERNVYRTVPGVETMTLGDADPGKNFTGEKISPVKKTSPDPGKNFPQTREKISRKKYIEKSIGKSIYQADGQRMDGTTSDWQESLNHFRNRLELDTLAARYDPEMLEEILNNIVEMYNCPLPTQTIGQYPQLTASIRKRLDMLTSQHIEYIMDALSSTKNPVKNIKAYLRTTILNAPITMEHYYQAQGNAAVANRPAQSPAPDIPQKVLLSQSLRRIGKAGAADG